MTWYSQRSGKGERFDPDACRSDRPAGHPVLGSDRIPPWEEGYNFLEDRKRNIALEFGELLADDLLPRKPVHDLHHVFAQEFPHAASGCRNHSVSICQKLFTSSIVLALRESLLNRSSASSMTMIESLTEKFRSSLNKITEIICRSSLVVGSLKPLPEISRMTLPLTSLFQPVSERILEKVLLETSPFFQLLTQLNSPALVSSGGIAIKFRFSFGCALMSETILSFCCSVAFNEPWLNHS